MDAACKNPNIGYDQWQRDTLLNLVKEKGFDVRLADKPCETDCSALVRVCVAHAFGYDVAAKYMGDARWSTINMCNILLKSGLFAEMVETKYTDSPDYLSRGDILCTKTQGHTVVALQNGPKFVETFDADKLVYTRLLKNGVKGGDVAQLQLALNKLGIVPQLDADGEFGPKTRVNVVAFQQANNLEVDGIVGKNTIAAINKKLDEINKPEPENVIVIGRNVCVRSGAGDNYKAVGTAKLGEIFDLVRENNGWNEIEFNGNKAYISAKYSVKITDGDETNER